MPRVKRTSTRGEKPETGDGRIVTSRKGERWARNAIKRGSYDAAGPWEFVADDVLRLLGDPPNWSRNANYYLGSNTDRSAQSAEHFQYPIAKRFGERVKVSRVALRNVRRAAEDREDWDVAEAAVRLLDLLDERQGRAEIRRAYMGVDELRNADQRRAGSLVFAVADVEVRAIDRDGRSALEGYAAVFDEFSEPMYWGREKIARGAFIKTLKSDIDVIANLEHEGGLNVLGRRSNESLDLVEDDRGLLATIYPPDTQSGRDTVLMVRDGYLRQMSFMFRVQRQELDETEDELVRTLLEVDLFDVAVVAMPAYPTTTVDLKRSIRGLRRDNADRRIRILERGRGLTRAGRSV